MNDYVGTAVKQWQKGQGTDFCGQRVGKLDEVLSAQKLCRTVYESYNEISQIQCITPRHGMSYKPPPYYGDSGRTEWANGRPDSPPGQSYSTFCRVKA
jgi:hypothetical protein